LRLLLGMASAKTTLLSTPEADEATSRAWRLYRRFGYVDVVRNFLFPGDHRPFARARPDPAPGPVKTVYWGWLAALVAAQICYPLTGDISPRRAGDGDGRGRVGAVGLARSRRPGGRERPHGWCWSPPAVAWSSTVIGVCHCVTRSAGTATGMRSGRRPSVCRSSCRSRWTWMAWPSLVVAGRLTRTVVSRVVVAGVALAAWDVFLDPQMVAAGYWHWTEPAVSLPGVPGVPLTNYLGWLAVATLMMAVLAPRSKPSTTEDAPMHALYLWTFYSSVLAHAVFLGLPGSAAWGAVTMGVIALPLTIRLLSQSRVRLAVRGQS
jgi:putative membrane protein